jgi:hypothetical protein
MTILRRIRGGYHSHPSSDDDDPSKNRTYALNAQKKHTGSKKKLRTPKHKKKKSSHKISRTISRPRRGDNVVRNPTTEETPNVRVYGHPEYWTQTTHQGPDMIEAKDNTKARHGISHKIKWDGNAESFKEYENTILSHCRQNRRAT